MKKSILALAISSVAFGAVANEVTVPVEHFQGKHLTGSVEGVAEARDVTITHSGTDKHTATGTITFTTVAGQSVSIDKENGDVTVKDKSDSVVYTGKIAKDGTGVVADSVLAKAQGYYDSNNGDVEVPQPINGIPVTREQAIEYAKENDLKNAKNVQEVIEYRRNNESKYSLQDNLTNEQKLNVINKQFATVDGQPKFSTVMETQGEMGGVVLINNQTGETYTQAQVDEMVVEAKETIKAEAESRMITPVDPEQPKRDGQAKEALAELYQAGQLTKEELTTYATTQQAAYATQESRIAQNEQDIFFLKDEVKRLDEKMDGVMAGVHAVNNARPYLMAEGDTAIGAGVGYAGSAGAVAFGAAHAFTDSLSASMTLNVTTGSYSEVSGGAGVQYKF